ncbi:tripartite tricarboxylate transporter TctB family protein [Sporomusa aerivorans]|uniref:tripartite tricarboxylate transporter TctB family protein n=1 Tax=Sporomusa aerivorans TaxID=204936 RepID=UPI00352A550B
MSERLVSSFFLLMSLVYVYSANELSFGSMSAPKAGFLPKISGTIAVVLAIIMVARSYFPNYASSGCHFNWRRLCFLVIGLMVYVILFNLSGYLATTFITMVYLLKVTETEGWLTPCMLSVGIAGCFYFVFVTLLGCNLP